MMRMFKLRREERGAAAIEMAIALPVLVFFIYGIFESALLLWASAGMQHAIGQGARLATIYPTPSATAVSTQVTSTLFGTYDAKSGYPQVNVVRNTLGSAKWYTITVTYKRDVTFLFLPSREITITHSKRVYTAQ